MLFGLNSTAARYPNRTAAVMPAAVYLDMLDEALRCGADIVMLDNMSIEEMIKAVRRVGGRAVVEASGNMGEKDLAKVAATGVDLISVGALTHSVRAMDISLKFD